MVKQVVPKEVLEVSEISGKKTISEHDQEQKVSKDVLDVICCPVDKADLKYDEKKNTLTCTKCKHVYEVKEGIPILLPKEKE